jgi:cytochrome c oxidase subunit II
MSAILPPAERLWYKHPIDRVEGTWIVIALLWCLIMFGMMVGWHIWGKQNLSTETYRTTPDKYMVKVQAMVDKHTVRTETDEKIRAATSTCWRGCGPSTRSSNWRRTRPTGCT